MKTNKYNNKKTVLDGFNFASKKEANRYSILKLLLKEGEIQNLRLQVPYLLHVGGVKICKYVADFVYEENGQTIVEDTKGFRTDVYKLKAKLMKAVYGITIKEV